MVPPPPLLLLLLVVAAAAMEASHDSDDGNFEELWIGLLLPYEKWKHFIVSDPGGLLPRSVNNGQNTDSCKRRFTGVSETLTLNLIREFYNMRARTSGNLKNHRTDEKLSRLNHRNRLSKKRKNTRIKPEIGESRTERQPMTQKRHKIFLVTDVGMK